MAKNSDRKQKALDELAKLDENVLVRLAEISKDKKALSFFQNALSFSILKGYLKQI